MRTHDQICPDLFFRWEEGAQRRDPRPTIRPEEDLKIGFYRSLLIVYFYGLGLALAVFLTEIIYFNLSIIKKKIRELGLRMLNLVYSQ